MKTYLDCIPCLVRQALDAARRGGASEQQQAEVMRETLTLLRGADFEQPPPLLAAQVHARIQTITGHPDPYHREKRMFNQRALELLPEFEAILENADDPFETAVRLSIAGNIIDFGANSQVDHAQVEAALAEALHAPLSTTAIKDLKQATGKAESILVLGDNAGEIVLDRLMLAQFPKERTHYAVRGAPIINDATREDAEFAGIAKFANLIDNGVAAPGTPLEQCGREFKALFDQADLIISKGQGNYETLSDCDKRIFFLLRVKCPMVARQIGHPLGALVIEEHLNP